MYRKITADFLFNGRQFIPSGTVLVTREDGTVSDLLPVADAGENIEEFDGIICPGLVNAHCHIELCHLKDRIPPHTGLCRFVEQVIRSRNDSIGQLPEAMQKACTQMAAEGIVAVGDICNTDISATLKNNSPLHWHNFIEISGMQPELASERLAAAIKIRNGFESTLEHGQAEAAGQSKKVSLTPHAPYSVSSVLFDEINRQTARQLVSLHNQESRDENDFYSNKGGGLPELYKRLGIDVQSFQPTGQSSLQSALSHFNQLQKVLLVHNCFIDRDDIHFMRRRVEEGLISDVSYCLCPNANEYIGGIRPPFNLLREEGVAICLGTDSLASNRQLSLVAEISTIQETCPDIPLEELLQWATSNGANALDLGGEIGYFKKSTRPGVVHIRLDDQGRITEGRRIL